MCSTTRVGMPSGPCQLAGSVSHAIVAPMSSIGGSAVARIVGVLGRGRGRVHGVSRRCSRTSTKSATIAITISGTAPKTVSVKKLWR